MNRRRVLLGIGALVSSGTALVGSGAFSTVEAERGLTVDVVADEDAYLRFTDQLAGADSDAFSTGADDGAIQFQFTDDIIGIQGNGLGSDSRYEFSNVFAAQNEGGRAIQLFGEYSEDDVATVKLLQTSPVSSDPGRVDPNAQGKSTPLTKDNPSDELRPGEAVALGFLIDTDGVDVGNYETIVTISAKSEGSEIFDN